MSTPVVAKINNPAAPELEDWTFYCPGCKHNHYFRVKGMPSPWTWNGDPIKPTVSPSIKVSSEFTFDNKPTKICHSFIRNGMIEFCGDSTHALAGQTVALEPI